ncbi:hypothetical protein OGATHE_001955 [Ogataea polymorpha]|uniref:Uncharacterized protein n=1 Tax=Ogataea polymorpha TaxID=460523 RepID=A0A9P8PLX4_9ASCO|nr:hypothetical protein OGATHE_001955 [Ogataea polymorpha]
MSGLLVAPMTKIPLLSLRPSSSVRRVLTTLELASLSDDSLFGTNASSSSKNIIHGTEALARVNTCLTARSDSPTYLLRSSGPLTEMKLAFDSLATALASSVLPQPGGPHISTPAGAVIPTFSYISGRLIGCTMAMWSSTRTFARAPTFAHVTSGMVAKPSLLADGWI